MTNQCRGCNIKLRGLVHPVILTRREGSVERRGLFAI
nr:MAG TPA: hypothetical protein [Caudoviricetes sp.]